MINLSPGDVVDDRYEIISCLGAGGMGSVYKAREKGLERVVALKFLQIGWIGEEQQRLRFEREGKILAALKHRNLITFYRFGVWQKQYPYLAMECLDGSSLSDVLRETAPLAPTRAISIAIQICAGMEQAHQSGIIHRDLKPGNVMLVGKDLTEVKVVDFGLARLTKADSSQNLTQTGALVGSVHYMSPEQCTGKKADARADIYATGCIIFEMLTGAPPFDADNPVGLLHKHANEEVPSMKRHNSQPPLPPGLEMIVRKALHKNPNDRYQSMGQMQTDLELVESGHGAEIKYEENSTTTRQPAGTQPRIRSMVGLAAAVVLASGAVLAHRWTTDTSLALRKPTTLNRKRTSDLRTDLRRLYQLGLNNQASIDELKSALSVAEGYANKLTDREAPLKMQTYALCAWLSQRLRVKEPAREEHLDNALHYLMLALPITETRRVRAESYLLANIGDIYLCRNELDKAYAHLLKALDIAEKRSPSTEFELDSELPGGQGQEELIFLNLQLGRIAIKMKRWDLAEKWLFKSTTESRLLKRGMNSTEVAATAALFEVLWTRGKKREMIALFESAEKRLAKDLHSGVLKDAAGASFYAALSCGPVTAHDMKGCLRVCHLAVQYLDASAAATTFGNVRDALSAAKEEAIRENNQNAIREIATMEATVDKIESLNQR